MALSAVLISFMPTLLTHSSHQKAIILLAHRIFPQFSQERFISSLMSIHLPPAPITGTVMFLFVLAAFLA